MQAVTYALLKRALPKATKHLQLVRTLVRWSPVVGCRSVMMALLGFSLRQCSTLASARRPDHNCWRVASFCSTSDTVLTCCECMLC